jgi:hypothetical protein
MIALTAVATCGLVTAQAADTTLTLACQGTTTSGLEDVKPEPISMGIVVNFTKLTVQGFNDPSFMDYPVKITAWNDVTVVFAGSSDVLKVSTSSTRGTIDRVTGDVEATSMVTDNKTGQDRNIDQLRAEVQASTADVLMAMTRASPHGPRALL